MKDIGVGWFVLVALVAIIVGYVWLLMGSSLGGPLLPPIKPVPS